MGVVSQVLVLFSLMLIGFVCAKLKALNKEAAGHLSSFVINISLPAMIFVSFQRPFSRELLGEAGIAMASSVFVYGSAFVIAAFYPRLLSMKGPERGVHRYALIIANCGFIGYPMVEAVLGEAYVFHAVIFNIPFNFLAYSVCSWIISKEGAGGFKLSWKNFVNLCVVATVLGLAFFILSIRLPAVLHRTLKMIGDTTSPLSMIVVGIAMASAKPGQIFGKWRIYVTVAMRLIVLPAFAAAMLYLFGLRGSLLLLAALLTAMPAGSTTSIMASHYNTAPEEASSLVFLSTLVCMVTIPIVVSIIETFVL